ncbi:hypothetical protein [Vibrio paucivorans]
MVSVLHGAIETLQQGRDFLLTLTDEQYCFIAKPLLTSSIGQHFRHWLDIFHALFQSRGVIDYNLRRRGHEVESTKRVALQEIDEFIAKLQRQPLEELNQSVVVLSEVSLSQSHTCSLESTFGRELTFAALHANHHFAMAKVATTLLDVKTCDEFGLAPATASFMREQ